MSRPVPFPSRQHAAYWGRGVIVEVPGGWISLHGHSHPGGVHLYWVGARNDRSGALAADGWPEAVKGRYVWATPDGGGPARICVAAP